MTLLHNQLLSLVTQYGWETVQDTLVEIAGPDYDHLVADRASRFVPMTGMELMLHEAMHSDWDSAWNRAADMVINEGIRFEDEHYNAPDIAAAVAYARHTRFKKLEMTGMELMRATVGYHNLPYPFCRHPEDCDGRGYCRHDPACND